MLITLPFYDTGTEDVNLENPVISLGIRRLFKDTGRPNRTIFVYKLSMPSVDRYIQTRKEHLHTVAWSTSTHNYYLHSTSSALADYCFDCLLEDKPILKDNILQTFPELFI